MTKKEIIYFKTFFLSYELGTRASLLWQPNLFHVCLYSCILYLTMSCKAFLVSLVQMYIVHSLIYTQVVKFVRGCICIYFNKFLHITEGYVFVNK